LDAQVEAKIRHFETLRNQRKTRETEWETINDYICPQYRGYFYGSGTVPLDIREDELIFDSHPITALRRFVAVLESILTPPAQRYVYLKPAVNALENNRNVRLWMSQATNVLESQRNSPNANFRVQNLITYHSVGAYGNGALFIDKPEGAIGFRYRNEHLAGVYPYQNHQGVIEGFYRYFSLSAREAAGVTGWKLPQRIVDAATDPQKCEDAFWFLHSVSPRVNWDPQIPGPLGKRYESCYISMDEKEFVSISGYNSLPCAFARYELISRNVNARGPSDEIIDAVKTLNEQAKTLITQGQRAVDPPILVHDDDIFNDFSTEPGSLNFGGIDSEGRVLAKAFTGGEVAFTVDMMKIQYAHIDAAYHLDLFRILLDNPVRTATDVLDLAKEKIALLGPTVGQLMAAYLGAVVSRELELAMDQQLLPPPPMELIEAGGEFALEFDSPLTRAQKAESAAGVLRTIQSGIEYANVLKDPSILDNINMDRAFRFIADANNFREELFNSPETVQALREQRAQAAQQQMMIDAAPGTAAMTNAVTKSRMGMMPRALKR
jgi:hypothetical protein